MNVPGDSHEDVKVGKEALYDVLTAVHALVRHAPYEQATDHDDMRPQGDSAPVRIPESKMIVISAGANTTLTPATRLHDRQEEPRTRTVSYGLDDLWEYL